MTHDEAIECLKLLKVFDATKLQEAVEMAITALERDRWISVGSPPDNMRDVLVNAFWHENWQTLMGWYDGKWHVIVNEQVREGLSVIAWREKPLPEPPKEET